MTSSFYNYSLLLPEGGRLYFNFYTLTMLYLDPAKAEKAERILEAPDTFLNEPGYKLLSRLLVKKGFLISDRIDERKILSGLFRQHQLPGASLNLTIAPTLNCNFKCVYCYETPAAISMTPKIEADILQFVASELEKKKSLSVTWFGGEPLLKASTIDRLSSSLLDLCKKRHVKYSASMITNGYLLDQKMVELLKRNSISLVQVTLDGPPAVHNMRRPHKVKKDNFDILISNLVYAAGKVNINLRMNVDGTNQDQILSLLGILRSKGLHRYISFYIGQVYPYTEVCHSVTGDCVSDQHFSLLDLNLGLQMLELGINGHRLPASKNSYCMADNLSSYAITPGGGITKCWNMISDPEPMLGSLNGAEVPGGFEAHNFHHRDPFAEACIECKLLPICMGGCPYLYKKEGKLKCHSWKFHLDEHLKLYYIIQKVKREREITSRFQSLVEKIKAISLSQ